MGLDLTIYYRIKGHFTENDVVNELAYGRKSWELVYALDLDNSTDYVEDQPISYEQWHRLINKIRPVSGHLDKISIAYDNYYSDKATAQDMTLIKLYEDWHKVTFNYQPQLGYEFSVGYIRAFWEADRNVTNHFYDPNYEVWVSVSY